MGAQNRQRKLGPYVSHNRDPIPLAQKQPNSKLHEDLKENELHSNGRWAAAITLMCYFYGNMSVATYLPKDPRQSTWILSRSPLPTLALCLMYIALVTWWGPKYMKNRSPIKGLRYVMMTYNSVQIVFNFWIFYELARNGWMTTYSLFCEPCNFSNESKSAIMMMHLTYWYYISKMLDFFDTIFFIANKKYEHISLLHVSHHALMPISTWFGLRYQPGGHTTFMGFLNTFVHVVMYSYYLLTAMGPRLRPYLWFKKYITTLQMVQFAAMFLHSFMTLIFLDCNVPKEFARWVGAMALVFQILFTDFYIKAYKMHASQFQMCTLDTTEFTKQSVPRPQILAEQVPDPGPHTGAIRKGAIHQTFRLKLRPDTVKRGISLDAASRWCNPDVLDTIKERIILDTDSKWCNPEVFDTIKERPLDVNSKWCNPKLFDTIREGMPLTVDSKWRNPEVPYTTKYRESLDIGYKRCDPDVGIN